MVYALCAIFDFHLAASNKMPKPIILTPTPKQSSYTLKPTFWLTSSPCDKRNL